MKPREIKFDSIEILRIYVFKYDYAEQINFVLTKGSLGAYQVFSTIPERPIAQFPKLPSLAQLKKLAIKEILLRQAMAVNP